MSQKIEKIYAREILDSRGNPTLEVTVTTKKGIVGKASVPSGASIGVHEALELRDGDLQRYGGKGVLKAVLNVNETISKVLKGQSVDQLAIIDQRLIELDGTENKSKLGANTMIGVSLACARAGALAHKAPLYKFINQFYKFRIKQYKMPVTLANLINGGRHSDSNLDIQEFWVVPEGIKSFSEGTRAISEVHHELGKILVRQGYDSDIGDEGGYAPDLTSNEEALQLILKAISGAGYNVAQDISLGIDAGSSTFFNSSEHKYNLDLDKLSLTSDEMINFYLKWLSLYPLTVIEDPLAEDDWEGWHKLSDQLAVNHPNLLLVGDDLFTTNIKRLQRGIDEKIANGIIIKPNQIGTLSETISCIKLAQENNYKIIVSHRSGGTEDTFISDLAVAVGAPFVKIGATSRSDRVAKYNRLMEIEGELKTQK
ncbi:phosphopyruvate hydratase [Patescibacteria group bacterium]|nr:phosphopyruvate hydratase [Patescibacteria group bacterium]